MENMNFWMGDKGSLKQGEILENVFVHWWRSYVVRRFPSVSLFFVLHIDIGSE